MIRLILVLLISIPLTSIALVYTRSQKGYWYQHYKASTDGLDAWRQCYVSFVHDMQVSNVVTPHLQRVMSGLRTIWCTFGPGLFWEVTGPIRYYWRHEIVRHI